MSWTHASRRHGIARRAARFVVEHCGLVYIQPAPPDSAVPDPRLVFLGDDEAGRVADHQKSRSAINRIRALT